ncbi:MAG: NADH-quinone oxidoreductase subunit C [Microthrixaceae bacterium]
MSEADAPPEAGGDVATSGPQDGDEEFLGCPVAGSGLQRTLHVPRERLIEVADALRADGYWMCVEVTGVDYLMSPNRPLPPQVVGERFEVVACLLDHQANRRLRLRVQVPEDDPTVPSLVRVWPSADFSERELWDLYGIEAVGHPGLHRILMPDTWEGHPLRKDFAVGAIPVQFKEA